jgi:hypothetical protein
MQWSRQGVVNVLRRAGMDDAAADALQALPDPVDSADIVPFCERHDMSKEEMMELMGSSP